MTPMSTTTTPARPTETLFSFPNPVNEVSARLVAGGVVVLCVAALLTREPLLLLLLAFGFVARVLTGPRISPLAIVVTKFVTPRLGIAPRMVPGPPKRFAQGIGATLSVAAVVAAFAFGAVGIAWVLTAAILVAATLESMFGFCVGCALFGLLMRIGVIPARVCAECGDISGQLTGAAR
jgi:hypothetical protein